MNFNQLMQKMRELDTPIGEAQVQECGDPMMGGMTPPMGSQTPPAHPSMSVNLNAQGMDNIESLLKLMTKVNPDMINQPNGAEAPGLPKLLPPGPSISSIGDLGNLDAGPLKMLPDLDKGPAPELDGGKMGDEPELTIDLDQDDAGDDVTKAMGDIDGDGDHDMDDHEAEEDEPEEKEKEEAFGNSAPNSDGPEYHDIKAAIPDGNDINKPKQMSKHSYKQGDNPMAMEGEELRASIRATLMQKLSEAKGAK